MRYSILLIISSFLVSCEFSEPIATVPGKAIDPTILGLWERKNDAGVTEKLLVLPLSETQYLVSFPAHTADAMFAKVDAHDVADRTLMQIEWVGTARGKSSDTKKVFQFATCTTAENSLSLRTLDSTVIGQNIAGGKALEEAIRTQKDNPKAFREAMVFQKSAE